MSRKDSNRMTISPLPAPATDSLITVCKVIFTCVLLAAMLYSAYLWHGFNTDYPLTPDGSIHLIPHKIPLINVDFPFLYKDYILLGKDTFPDFILPVRDSSYILIPEVPYFSGCWMGVQVSQGEMDSCAWILNHTTKSDKFVNDIPGAELVMGMTTRVSTVGGDWANAKNASRDMYYNSEIYRYDQTKADDLARIRADPTIGEEERASQIARITGDMTNDTARAHELARLMNATYLVYPERMLSAGAFDGYSAKEKFNNSAYFQPVYSNKDVTIYRVLP